MTLVLQGIKLNDEPMSQPLIGRFDERGGTVGRSDNATFTLPDPERLISRVQAQILFRDEGYWIENVSTANSTLHNGRPLSAGMRILLRDGDELKIGGYTLVTAFENDETSATILRGRTVIMQPQGPPTRPREVGMTAGMRSVLEALLDRFDPTQVEALLTDGSVFDSLMPTHRRARLWGLYLEHYRSIREQARGDLQRLVREALRHTHEEQVRNVNLPDELATYEATISRGVNRD